jgi:hypothetical protein
MKKITQIRLAATAAGSLTAVGSAMAALPAVVGTTLTAISADGLALIDLVWPVVGAITGGFILFKLFKRGSAKI